MKPRVTREFELSNGRRVPRASMEDIPTMGQRVLERMLRVISDEEVNRTLALGHNAYNSGKYEDALTHFEEAIEIAPSIEEELYPHLIICRRVLRIEKDYRDALYEERLYRWESSLFRRFRKSPELQIRCKYCGHYTEFIHPNDGWGWSGNQCYRCAREYPMPDFLWDSLDGQAYIYYRRAASGWKFYREFEQMFDVEEPHNLQIMMSELTDSVSRNEAIEIVHRTQKNLKYIREAFEQGEDVHVVTQLVTSLLGLIVLPREQYFEKDIWKVKLDTLIHQGWPEWNITLGNADNLGDLIRHIRNATAHGRITFSSDSRHLSEVMLVVEDANRRSKGPYWRAEISGEDLYLFCIRFAECIEEALS